jgi:hypothetical protein
MEASAWRPPGKYHPVGASVGRVEESAEMAVMDRVRARVKDWHSETEWMNLFDATCGPPARTA